MSKTPVSSTGAIKTMYLVNKIEQILQECYEKDQFHHISIDPRWLKDAGTIKIEIMGIPFDHALNKFNEIMKD